MDTYLPFHENSKVTSGSCAIALNCTLNLHYGGEHCHCFENLKTLAKCSLISVAMAISLAAVD